ncbi:hypothetical protein ACWD4G_03585 [Streptomyces sp. NPDC002643]
MTDERAITEAEVSSLPTDVETISATVALVGDMALSTSRREDIDARTDELIGHLNLLRSQCLGEDENQDTLKLLRLVDRHLAMGNRPSRRAQAHEAFNYMHDSAIFTKALLAAYEMHGSATS